MAASETPTALGTCPTDEDLAAYLDGMLAKPERARITAHLADCESCYEIFAGAAHFMQDSAPAQSAGRIVPFPSHKDGGGGGALKRWGIPAAAAAVLVLGVGLAGYRIYFTDLMAPELIASLQGGEDPASHLHRFTAYRGLGDDAALPMSRQPSFLVGARLVDLQILLDKGQRKDAAELLRGIGKGIEAAALIGKDENAKLYTDATEQLDSGGPEALGKIKAAAPQWEVGLKDSASLDQDFLNFGKWAEAGRLAAETRSEDFFSRRNRRFLTHISQTLEEEKKARGKESPAPDGFDDFDAEAERNDTALAELRGIAAIWDRGDLQAGDYAKLAGHFGAILRTYDV
jgi:hypothetical protein